MAAVLNDLDALDLVDWAQRRFNPVPLRRALVVRGLLSDVDMAAMSGISKSSIAQAKSGRSVRPKTIHALLALINSVPPLDIAV